MPRVHREAIVAHRASDLYQLVADVGSYPSFVPWCVEGSLLKNEGDVVEARLMFAYRGLRQGFTTRNRLVPDRSITMRLVEGPFQSLEGVWDVRSFGASPVPRLFGLHVHPQRGVVRTLVAPHV